MLLLEIKKEYLRKKYGDIEWEAVFNTTIKETITRDNRDLGTPERSLINGVIIRVLLPDKRVGLSVETNPDKWKQCFKKAYKTAKVNKTRNKLTSINSNERHNANNLTFKNFEGDELFKTLNMMKHELGSKASLIKMKLSKEVNKTRYYNHNNASLVHKEDNVSALIQVGSEGRTGYGFSSKRMKLPDFTEVVNEAVKYYNWSKQMISVKSGKYPVLFAHDALNTVLQPIKYSLLGDNIVEKKSKFVNKIGEEVFDSKIILMDNPLHENNFSPFDCEGFKTRKTKVVENGVIKSFLHDSYTSNTLNTKNTFNSSDIMSKPSVSFFNPEMKGTHNLNEMIEETEEGFLLYDLYPGHTINNITGDFGLNSSTFFYLKNGRVKGLLKGGVITGNSFETFKHVESISKEKRSDLGGYNLPVVKTTAHILTQ